MAILHKGSVEPQKSNLKTLRDFYRQVSGSYKGKEGLIRTCDSV